MLYDSKQLVEGTDYTLSYQDNVNVGTATIVLTGKGNYTGTATVTFTISWPESPFRDVTAPGVDGRGGPHYEDILWLADSGISTGWKEGDGTRTFRPANTVVRQDMAAFLHRLDGLG